MFRDFRLRQFIEVLIVVAQRPLFALIIIRGGFFIRHEESHVTFSRTYEIYSVLGNSALCENTSKFDSLKYYSSITQFNKKGLFFRTPEQN